jgi:hypothetical protein
LLLNNMQALPLVNLPKRIEQRSRETEQNSRESAHGCAECEKTANPSAGRLFVLLEISNGRRPASCSPLFEIALVLVRLDHVASFNVNANHSIM